MSPEWAEWRADGHGAPYTLGIEEELMLLDGDGALAFRSEEVMARLPEVVRERASLETHASVIEIETGPHETVRGAVAELAARREATRRAVAELGLAFAAAGTHPTTTWKETEIPGTERSRRVADSMRALARREATMAMHVHVAVASGEQAVAAYNALRERLPLALALSANSPYWQGRDTGLASTRTPLFHAFPRTGIPAPFADYGDWVERVGALTRSGAIPDPSFLWWDVRLQPALGTVEVRIMDAQTDLADAAAIAALVQCWVQLAVERGEPPAADHPEALLENRFLACRDGIEARFVRRESDELVPIRAIAEVELAACGSHAEALGCAGELARVRELLHVNGAARQREVGERDGIDAVAPWLAERTAASPGPTAAAPPSP